MNRELPANTTLSHYLVASRIGAGVMGDVYLAHDTKLDRKVALKLVPLDLDLRRQEKTGNYILMLVVGHPN